MKLIEFEKTGGGTRLAHIAIALFFVAASAFGFLKQNYAIFVIEGAVAIALIVFLGKDAMDGWKKDPVVLRGTLSSIADSHRRGEYTGYLMTETDIKEFSFPRNRKELFQLLLQQEIELTIGRRSKQLLSAAVVEKGEART